jgi:antitoxin MazE
MPETLKLRRFGGSLGVILPKSVTESLSLEEGDELHVTSTPDGVKLTPFDPDFESAMNAFHQVRKQYRNTLRKLSE